MYMQETYLNRDQHCIDGETDVDEAFYDTVGDLYRACVRAHGRCIGKNYLDNADGRKSRQVGWVFLKREKYLDCDESYLRETWVSVHDAPPDKTITYHYHEF